MAASLVALRVVAVRAAKMVAVVRVQVRMAVATVEGLKVVARAVAAMVAEMVMTMAA